MSIRILQSYQAKDARGLVVVVDVLRAFTTVCYIAKNGARKIIAVFSLKKSRALKKKNSKLILIGERKGIKPKDFDFGNSPAEIESKDFSNKTIVFSTTRGTRAIYKTVNAEEIITGSFVNAKAVVNYIKKKKPKVLSFVVTESSKGENEDLECVNYIKSILTKRIFDFQKVRSRLIKSSRSEGFLKNSMTKYSKRDFYLSLELDRFNFVLKVERDKKNNLAFLKKI